MSDAVRKQTSSLQSSSNGGVGDHKEGTGGGGRGSDDNASLHQMLKVSAAAAASVAAPLTAAVAASSSSSSSLQQQQQQQQQQQTQQRQQALAEAQAVLDAIGGEHYLDGFNLLQVIANPWGTSTNQTSSSSSSAHGRYNSGVMMTSASRHGGGHGHHHMAGIGGGGGDGATTSATGESSSTSDIFQDTYHTLESTVVSVTEQMEALNSVLEDWSRHLLSEDPNSASTSGGGGGGGDDAVPESQLQELPAHLQNLNLGNLQTYLERSGRLAQAFSERHPLPLNDTTATTTTTVTEQQHQQHPGQHHEPGGAKLLPQHQQQQQQSLMQTLQGEIPDSFWQVGPEALDLTDPVTFQSLFLTNTTKNTDLQQQQQHQQPTAAAAANDVDDDNDISVYSWFPLVAPDALNPILDQVEMALLEAVRQQSGAFFEESVRFATLQQVIVSLIAQVVALQHSLDDVIGGDDYLQPLLHVPQWAAQKSTWQQLVALLDVASELLTCKQSIAGFLAAGDDQTALEQIQYARRQLLLSQSESSESSSSQPATDDAVPPSSSSSSLCCLNQLIAFSSVGRQLDQYEQLIVTNLREELVEVFLDWKVPINVPPSLPIVSTAAAAAAAAAAALTTITTSSSGGGSGSGTIDRVRDIMSALRHCHALQDTRTAYHNRLQDVMRLTVRTVVGEFAAEQQPQQSSSSSSNTTSTTTTAMTLERFLDCFDLTAEQLLALLQSASQVDAFCVREGFMFHDDIDADDPDGEKNYIHQQQQSSSSSSSTPAEPLSTAAATTVTPLSEVLVSAAELSSKSMSELLRLRKDAHSLVTLEEMKRIWDKCLAFTTQLEALSGGRTKATALRSTLLAQAKAFCDRQHESNMSALVAALDSERWTQCEVSAERQAGLTRLCSGRSVWSSSPHLTLAATDVSTLSSSPSGASIEHGHAPEEKKPQVEVEGIRYKVVWSCLLLVEMILGDLAAAAHFHSLASSVVAKVAELLRLFNSRTTQLVLGAGAIHSAARLKSINAKHLSLVTQCLGMAIAILPHVRAALMAQMPTKQHTLLNILDQIKREYADHNEKVLNKFVTIIGSIVEHGLTPKLSGTDFDKRAEEQQKLQQNGNDNVQVSCCVFLEGVSSNTRKMHQVLYTLLPPEHLQDVFSRIFAFVDQKIPTLLVSMDESDKAVQGAGNVATASPKKTPVRFSFPTTDAGKRQLLLEVECMTQNLNGLDSVQPWDFTAVSVLEKKLEYTLLDHQSPSSPNGKVSSGDPDDHGDVMEKESSELDSEAETDVTTDPGDADEHNTALPNNSLTVEATAAAAAAATETDTNDDGAAFAGSIEASTESKPEPPTVAAAAAVDESQMEGTENGGSAVSDYPVEVTTL